MTNASAVTGTYAIRTVGLVSVDGRTYPLKSARVEARAEGGVAATTFTQSYGNPYQEPLEVLYTLPLPASGAVVGYAIRLGQKVIRGEVRRREEAQEEYRKALLEGRTAALLEQDRADTFTQKLGCLPPGETAEVEIEVLQPLAFLSVDGEKPAQWEYRFPTVAGVRYEGARGRVPDAEKLDVDRADGTGIPVRLEARLFLADGAGGEIHPEAPGQEISLEDREGGVQVALREKMKLDRDLIIRWSATQQQVGVRFVEGKGLPCDPGRYLLITLTPPAVVDKGLARDLTILIDASGSMSGNPLSRAKVVTEELLRSLESGDRFEILAFASRVEPLVSRPVAASEKNVRQALAALSRLEAGGSTEMTQAIMAALKPLRADSQRQVILLSDGYIGFEGEVIGEILRRLVPGARLHAVGIGTAPNRTLTRGAARAGRGVEILVGDDDDARVASRRLLRATVRPVLTDVEVSGPALAGLAPQRPQDILEGQPLVLLAEITAAGGHLEVRGRQPGNRGVWAQKIEIASAEGQGPTPAGKKSLNTTTLPLGALFGREAIEDVELQLAAAARGEEAGAFDQRIEALGLRHGIASRKTSLVAVSEDPTVDPKDPRRRQRLAVELPAEVSAEGAGLVMSALAIAAPAAPRMARFLQMPHICQDFLSSLRLGERDGEEESKYEADYFQAHEAEELAGPMEAGGAYRIEIVGARVLQLDDHSLILEFEVPEDGFNLPYDGMTVQVRFDDGTVCDAQVLGRESSPYGPHEAGLTVRLGLTLADPYNWHHGEAHISWRGSDGADVDLHIIF
jgi:Ca-activated chloride channel family protein